MVVDLLGPLVGARGQLQLHHMGPLEGFMYHLWAQSADINLWVRRVRVALHLVENGFNQYPTTVAPVVCDTLSRLGPVQMEVFEATKEAWDSTSAKIPDARFRPILSAYPVLYERFYPLLAASFVVADACLRALPDPTGQIDTDGRVRPAVVEGMETARSFPQGLLSEGVSRHLRNTIAHGRYQVLSADQITMEDRNAAGKLTWGPHTFTHADLREQVLSFNLTCEALLAALILFDVNNHRTIRERGFATPRQQRLRLDLIQSAFEHCAEMHGFDCEKVEQINEDTLLVAVKVSGEREYGPHDIYVGGGRAPTRHYVRPVRNEDAPVRTQAYGLLQTTLDAHDSYGSVILEVSRQDGSPIGCLVANLPAREALLHGPSHAEKVRALLEEDSIADDEKMPVVVRGVPTSVR